MPAFRDNTPTADAQAQRHRDGKGDRSLLVEHNAARYRVSSESAADGP
jgi:hypothetical protein